MKTTYQLTAKQLVLVALVTALFASGAVVLYDKVGSAMLSRLVGARTEKTYSETPLVAADAAVAGDEANNQQVYKAASPGVVNITSIVLVQDWFNVYPQKGGTGSGSIIDKEGRILTNFHVIQDAKELQVTLANNNNYVAKVLGVDPDNDLAVIKIDAPAAELATIPLGDSDALFVGQKVLAIGNPFGFDRTLTTGVVSGLARPLKSEMTGRLIEGAIQTDAAINPGNSGGPLLNSRGQMIGINTMIYSPSGGSVGIGFAVPVKTAKRVINDILQYGRVRKPTIGIETISLKRFSSRLIEALDLPTREGLMVIRVVPGSPAERAGIENAREVVIRGNGYPLGDVITKVDGQKITDQEDLDRLLNSKNVGDRVQIELFREGKPVTLAVTLAERRLRY